MRYEFGSSVGVLLPGNAEALLVRGEPAAQLCDLGFIPNGGFRGRNRRNAPARPRESAERRQPVTPEDVPRRDEVIKLFTIRKSLRSQTHAMVVVGEKISRAIRWIVCGPCPAAG